MADASLAVRISHRVLWVGTGVIVPAAIGLIAMGMPLGWVLLLSELGGAAGLAGRTLYQSQPRARRYLGLSSAALMIGSAVALVVVVLDLFPPASSIHLVP